MSIQKTSAAAETPGPERSSNKSGWPPMAAGTTEAPAFPRRVTEDVLNELARELARRLNELVDTLEKRS